MKDTVSQTINHVVEHPTTAKIISSATVALGGVTAADLIPWAMGLLATTAGIIASIMVIRSQRALRIKTELEIDNLRRAEEERRERAMQSPRRRQDDPEN